MRSSYRPLAILLATLFLAVWRIALQNLGGNAALPWRLGQRG